MRTAPNPEPTVAELLDLHRKMARVCCLSVERGQMAPERAMAAFDRAEADLVEHIYRRCVSDPTHRAENLRRYHHDVLPCLLQIRADTTPVFEGIAELFAGGSFA